MTTERLSEFDAFLKELRKDQAGAKAAFTALFQQGCDLLELDNDDAAKAFETSRPNISRWRRGKVVPPAAGLVLGRMREHVEAKIKTLKRVQTASGAGGGYACGPAMAAKGHRS